LRRKDEIITQIKRGNQWAQFVLMHVIRRLMMIIDFITINSVFASDVPGRACLPPESSSKHMGTCKSTVLPKLWVHDLLFSQSALRVNVYWSERFILDSEKAKMHPFLSIPKLYDFQKKY